MLVYVDIDRADTATADLDFTFTGDSTIRNWDIKVTQILCGENAFVSFFFGTIYEIGGV